MKLPALLSLLLFLAVGCVHPDDQRIAKTHQLRVGMTPAEVEKLVVGYFDLRPISLGFHARKIVCDFCCNTQAVAYFLSIERRPRKPKQRKKK